MYADTRPWMKTFCTWTPRSDTWTGITSCPTLFKEPLAVLLAALCRWQASSAFQRTQPEKCHPIKEQRTRVGTDETASASSIWTPAEVWPRAVLLSVSGSICIRLEPIIQHRPPRSRHFLWTPPPSIPTFIKPWYGLKLGWLFALSSTKLTLIICGWTCVFVDWGWGVEFFSIWEQGNEAVDGELRKECNKYEGNTHSWFKVGHIGWLKDEPCLSKFLHLKIKHRQTDRQMMKLHVSVLNGETSVFDVYNCFIAI